MILWMVKDTSGKSPEYFRLRWDGKKIVSESYYPAHVEEKWTTFSEPKNIKVFIRGNHDELVVKVEG